MSVGLVHNQIMITRLRDLFRDVGADTTLQCPVVVCGRMRFIDLMAELNYRRIVVEVECSPKRIASDLEKAMALDSDELWIVVPNGQIRAAVGRKLSRLRIAPSSGLFVLTLPQAAQRVANCFRVNCWAFDIRKQEKKFLPQQSGASP